MSQYRLVSLYSRKLFRIKGLWVQPGSVGRKLFRIKGLAWDMFRGWAVGRNRAKNQGPNQMSHSLQLPPVPGGTALG